MIMPVIDCVIDNVIDLLGLRFIGSLIILLFQSLNDSLTLQIIYLLVIDWVVDLNIHFPNTFVFKCIEITGGCTHIPT